MRLTPPSLLIPKTARDQVVRCPINICSFSQERKGKSGAVRHSHLLLPIILHWKEVGPDRLVLVDTIKYKIRSFPACSSPILNLPTYTTPTQLIQVRSTKLSTIPPLPSIQTLHFAHVHVQPLLNQKKKMAPITPLLRTLAQRRTLSVFTRVRSIAQTAELPFSHLPHQKGAKADWGKQFRHVGDAAML
jgi:hypothetical protein